MHPQLAHIAERHPRPGWVLALVPSQYSMNLTPPLTAGQLIIAVTDDARQHARAGGARGMLNHYGEEI